MRRQKSTIQYYDKQRTIGPREITLGAAVLALVLCAAVGVIFLLRNSGWIGIAAPPSPTPTETPTPPPTATAPPVTLTPETPSAPEAPADAPEPTPQYFEHVVGEGDSLAGLAALYGVPLQRLAEVNNLPLNTMLREGQVLVIPLPPDRAGRWHVVQPGETLIGIAEDYGVEPAQIQSANNIGEGGEIYAGQRIRIPFVPPEDPTPEGGGAGGSPAGDALTLPTRIHRSGWARSTLNGNLARNYPLTHENPRFTLHYQPDSYAQQTLADTVALVEGALIHVEQTLDVHLDGTFDIYLAGTLFAAPNAHLMDTKARHLMETPQYRAQKRGGDSHSVNKISNPTDCKRGRNETRHRRLYSQGYPSSDLRPASRLYRCPTSRPAARDGFRSPGPGDSPYHCSG
jgi:LysM repeat protein